MSGSLPHPSRGGRLVLLLAAGVAAVLILGRLAASAYVEVLWHAGSGYQDVFWTRVLWQWGARVLAGLCVGVLLHYNLRVVAGTLGGIQIKRRFGNLEISEQLPHSYAFRGSLAISALMALWFGAAVPASVGMQALALVNAGAWGVVEPILGRDASFYVFWLPLLARAVTFAMVVVFLVFTLVVAGYAATGALRWSGTRVVAQEVARLHLGLLLGAFFLLLAGRLWLGRSLLLLDGGSAVQGIVGFADVEARLPALQTLAVISVSAGAVAAWGAWRGRGPAAIGSVVAVPVGALLIGQLYPALVQRFRVEPNELARETPFIEHNLAFTRRGLGLDRMERRRFAYDLEGAVDWEAGTAQLEGLPVWSSGALLTTFRAVDARFPYYDFSSVAIDRYRTADGDLVPVAVSVREVDPGGIQDPNWQNLHLRERYVTGLGAVASLATERTPEGRPRMLLTGIPPVASGDGPPVPALRLERPQVHVGSRPQLYSVVTPAGDRYLAPDGTPGRAGTDFPPGIALSSTLRTLALAWRFRDANLLFATELTEESRFVYRRRVVERARAIAPFLRFPEEPYPVVEGGRIVWILEGFTATRAFPLATAHEIRFLPPATWVRNSVKVTVDAVTGRVDFYRVPVDDPLADAYARAFPGLLKPLDAMPDGLREHLRYPRELLNLQARALLQYHQETAPAFHGQQDVWSSPTELAQGANPVAYEPGYGVYQLPGDDRPRFTLTTVFVPTGRQNLTAILAARTEEDGTPELVLYDLPVEDQVPGPRQIEALVEQDPIISQQFSLWRTGGSEVWTGHLHVVPVGGRIVYMEPVFLAAAADAIPELRRFVVSDGPRVAMTEELSSSVRALGEERTPELLAGATVPGSPESDADADAEAVPSADAAIELLRRAQDRLGEGDWAGFGRAMDELRALLERLARAGGATVGGSAR